MKQIKVIDSHTGGEPTRLVVEGLPDLAGAGKPERREQLAIRHEDWRAASHRAGTPAVRAARPCRRRPGRENHLPPAGWVRRRYGSQ